MRCGGAVRAVALCLAVALCSDGAPPAAGLRWALAGAGAGGAVGVVDLGDGPRWLPALHARAAAPLLLWRAPPNPAVGCAPQWLEGARGYVLAAGGARRLVHFLVRDTSEAVWSQMYGFITGNPHRNMQLDSGVPIVMAISTKPLEENDCSQNIAGSQYCRANHSARGIVQVGARSPPSGALSLERGSEEESGRRREEWGALQGLRRRHQSFRGVVLREGAAGTSWRATAVDPATGRKRVYKWNSGGDEDGVEGELASAALLAARSPGPTDISVRAVVLSETGYANFTESFGGVKVQVVGHFHRLLEEMRKRLRFTISLSQISARDFITGQQVAGNMEKMVVMGEIDLVPQYFKYVTTTLGSSTLMDIVSSGEFDRQIVLVPFASPLPAWSLPLRVFSPRIWLALLGTAVAYALAWCTVAGESLAASAAAALRAFSSCGGAPQDRVRATPQRLQLAAALLASAVIVAAAYQGRLFDLITNPQYEEQINTLDQLANEKMTLLIGNSEMFLEMQERLPKIHILAYNSRQELSELFRNKTNERYAMLYDSKLWQMFGAFRYPEIMLYRNMREIVSSFQPQFISRRNWPWSELLKVTLLQMEETGLVQKWMHDFNASVCMAARLGKHPEPKPQPRQRYSAPKVLQLEDVVGHLQLLGAGLCAAALAFCAELRRGCRAGEGLRVRSQRARARLRRICAALRQVGAQIREFGLRVNARLSAPQP